LALSRPPRIGLVHAGEGGEALDALRAVSVATAPAGDASAAAAVLASCDVLVTWCASESDADTLLARREGLLWRAPPGLTLIDFSPITPRLMKAIAQRCATEGYRAHGAALSCSGGASRAFVDESVMQDASALEAVQAIAPDVVQMGPAGSSKAMSIVECLLASVARAASDEAIAIAAGAGIDASVLIPLLLKGSGGNSALGVQAGREPAPDSNAVQAGLALAREAAREYRHPTTFGALAFALSCRRSSATEASAPARGRELAA